MEEPELEEAEEEEVVAAVASFAQVDDASSMDDNHKTTTAMKKKRKRKNGGGGGVKQQLRGMISGELRMALCKDSGRSSLCSEIFIIIHSIYLRKESGFFKFRLF